MSRLGSDPALLAADVGGTKTTFALYDGRDVRAPRAQRTYQSSDAPFDVLLARFLDGAPAPASACLAVAGPVVGRSVRVTNLPWSLSASELEARFSFTRVDLLNDVEALSWATAGLRSDEVARVVQEGQLELEGPVAVLALGTGLGEGFLVGRGDARRAYPSEGGHADFAPTTALQARLLASLWPQFQHVSVERVCSGTGLPRIYRFLANVERYREDPDLATEIASAVDPTPLIVRAAESSRSSACREAVALLCDILASEAGNLALKLLATGGVYLGGGMAPRLLSFLQSPRFRDSFLAKGRFASFLERVPVRVVLPADAVLWGAALHGMSALQLRS